MIKPWMGVVLFFVGVGVGLLFSITIKDNQQWQDMSTKQCQDNTKYAVAVMRLTTIHPNGKSLFENITEMTKAKTQSEKLYISGAAGMMWASYAYAQEKGFEDVSDNLMWNCMAKAEESKK